MRTRTGLLAAAGLAACFAFSPAAAAPLGAAGATTKAETVSGALTEQVGRKRYYKRRYYSSRRRYYRPRYYSYRYRYYPAPYTYGGFYPSYYYYRPYRYRRYYRPSFGVYLSF